MIRAAALGAACLLLSSPAAAATVSLIVEEAGQAQSARELAGGSVRVLSFTEAVKIDPMEKGRFLSAVEASDVVVAAGPESCAWLNREVEDKAIRCLPPYNGSQILDYARLAGWTRVAAVYTAGYEDIYRHLRGAAKTRGIELAAASIGDRRDLSVRVEPLLASMNALWVLGDPLLTEGAAFDYLVERSLAHGLPLIAPEPSLVERGAFLSVETDKSALLRHAVAVATAAARGVAAPAPEPKPGRLIINEVLSRKWRLGRDGRQR